MSVSGWLAGPGRRSRFSGLLRGQGRPTSTCPDPFARSSTESHQTWGRSGYERSEEPRAGQHGVDPREFLRQRQHLRGSTASQRLTSTACIRSIRHSSALTRRRHHDLVTSMAKPDATPPETAALQRKLPRIFQVEVVRDHPTPGASASSAWPSAKVGPPWHSSWLGS